MKDMLAHWDRLRADADEFALVGDLATDAEKRELYTLMTDQITMLASEIERVLTAKRAGESDAQ
jgi:hypothetical protein